MKTGLLAVIVVSGCIGAGAAYRDLPANDRDAFDACYAMVRGRSCGDGGPHGVYADICMSEVVKQYAALASSPERRVFLVESGCPSPVVARFE